MHYHWLNNQPFIAMIMQSQDSFALCKHWPTWITCSFPILITFRGVPAVVMWFAREYACVCCIIRLQKKCWPGIGEAVGSWERPLCLLVHQGTEDSHCESGQCWVRVLSIFFPPPFHSPAQSRTREGEESGFSLMDQAQELSEEESQSAVYNCLSWSWAIPQQPAWMLQSDSFLPPLAWRANQSALNDGMFIVMV